MPRYFFHLSAPDQVFPDPVGSDVGDLADAHSRALRLAERVMTYSVFADCVYEFRRWTVKITDQNQELLMTVIFPSSFVPTSRKPVSDNGIRTLLRALDAMVDSKSVIRRCSD
jgi:hypothetical protein